VCSVFVSAIPDWHWAWQFTHGREAINPMPLLSERIVRLRGNGSTPNYGVGAYSEGVADDLNRAIWSGIAADPRQSAAGLVEQYAQYHFHAAAAPAMQSALLGLEQNWIGDISTNRHIESTLLSLQAAERLTPPDELLTNWRLQMYLYRGYYDAFVQARFRHEQQCEQTALNRLARASTANPASAIRSALVQICCVNLVPGCPANHTGTVPRCDLPPAQRAWRERVVQLQAMINASVGIEVVQRQTKDLNLVDTPHANIDNPLNDAAHLAMSLATILQLKSTAAQYSAIQFLLNRTDPGPGGFYEDFGDGGPSAHLIAGPGPEKDPAYYFSPLTQAWPAKHSHGNPPCTTKLAWTRYASSFYDNPLTMQFEGLDVAASYTLQIVYYTSGPLAGVNSSCVETPTCRAPIQLMANEQLLHAYAPAPLPMQVLSFPLAQNTTRRGSVRVSCNQEAGQGGDGRACCISEVWLRRRASSRGGGE
jgi:hypothetical protein